MYIPKVERLCINFKTLENFKQFKGSGSQELSMLEDLQANIIENDSESPFYGIYFGESLVARMSLYKQHSFVEGTYLELFKLEVLPEFKRRGFGTALVDYAKSIKLPIKTVARTHSKEFWEKQGFFQEENNQVDMFLWNPNTAVDTKEESA